MEVGSALARAGGVESLLFRDGHISPHVPIAAIATHEKRDEMTLRQITGVYLSLAREMSRLNPPPPPTHPGPPTPLLPSSAAVLCLYHGARGGQQCLKELSKNHNICM